MSIAFRILLSILSTIILVSILSACGSGSSSSSGATQPYISFGMFSFPTGSVPPPGFHTAMVVIKNGSGGADITNAIVTVNSTTLTYNSAAGHMQYEGDVIVPPSGVAVNLSVTINGNTYGASVYQWITCPTIVTPSSSATWSVSNSNTVTWSGGGQPNANAVYALGVLNSNDPSGNLVWPLDNSLKVFYPATTFTDTIPAGSLSTGNREVIVCSAAPWQIANTTADSVMVIAGCNYVTVTVN